MVSCSSKVLGTSERLSSMQLSFMCLIFHVRLSFSAISEERGREMVENQASYTFTIPPGRFLFNLNLNNQYYITKNNYQFPLYDISESAACMMSSVTLSPNCSSHEICRTFQLIVLIITARCFIV